MKYKIEPIEKLSDLYEIGSPRKSYGAI